MIGNDENSHTQTMNSMAARLSARILVPNVEITAGPELVQATLEAVLDEEA